MDKNGKAKICINKQNGQAKKECLFLVFFFADFKKLICGFLNIIADCTLKEWWVANNFYIKC